MGADGLITKVVKTSFYSEMSAIEEKKEISKIVVFMSEATSSTIENNFLDEKVPAEDIKKFSDTLKAEIIFTRNAYGKKEPLETKKIWKENFFGCRDIFENDEYINGLAQDISYISKEASGKTKKYIYDSATDVCYKIADTHIDTHIVHSLQYAKFIIDGENANGVGIVDTDSGIMVSLDGAKCYEPNLNNFSYKTEIIYYSPDLKQQQPMNIKEFIKQGRPATMNYNGETYIFANYTLSTNGTKNVWANIKTTANGVEGYWVWIPRFAYKLNSSDYTSEIIFVDISDKPIDTEKYGDSLPSDYTVHEAFKQQDGLKGIWFSKYAPTPLETLAVDNTEPEVPDLSNFSSKDTKLIYYTLDGKKSIPVDYTEKPEQTIEQDGETYYFYNYPNRIWANIKTTANELEGYWVWIPRFAYKLESGTSSVILIDINNKPIDKQTYGDVLPPSYTVHEAFIQQPNLKGIWFSKYAPTKQEEASI